MGGKTALKSAYFDKLKSPLEEYRSAFIVTVDNFSSQQMHEIRQSLRGEGVVLMGKHTMVRRAIKTFIADDPEYERLLPHVRGNVGFVFTNGDLKASRDKILANRVAAPARASAVPPGDVFVSAGNTGMEPGKTSFFQALGVPTKIAHSTIEITADLKLAEAGTKVGASKATLLNMLNISPFASAITIIVSISLALNFPTLPSIMHSVVDSYKNLISIALETEYEWEAIHQLKDRVKNPDAYAAATPATASSAAPVAAADKEEAPAEEEEASDEDMGFGLFDQPCTGATTTGARRPS